MSRNHGRVLAIQQRDDGSETRPTRWASKPTLGNHEGETGSPQTVETSVVVIVARAGWPCCARARPGQAWTCPLFLPTGAAGVPGVRGGLHGRRPLGDAQHPNGPGWRPRTLSGHSRASGGEAASFSWPAQWVRRAHPAFFPASDRS
jgi:hypothetical protein